MDASIEELKRLHGLCVNSLGEFIKESNRSCELLNDISDFPVSVEKKVALVKQRNAENQAHMTYLGHRNRLFDAAKWIE